MVPLLVTIKNNVVFSVVICKDGEDLEEKFKKECENYGVEANDCNFDDGFMELEDGTSICMSWAETAQ